MPFFSSSHSLWHFAHVNGQISQGMTTEVKTMLNQMNRLVNHRNFYSINYIFQLYTINVSLIPYHYWHSNLVRHESAYISPLDFRFFVLSAFIYFIFSRSVLAYVSANDVYLLSIIFMKGEEEKTSLIIES